MSHLKRHRKISKRAYQILLPKIRGYFFPLHRSIKIFDTLLSPDVIHSFKFIKGYEKYNHLNTENYPQGLDFAIKFYGKLALSLREKKFSAHNASWLAHFIVDCLEPAHLEEWKGGGGSEEALKKHIWLETQTKDLEPVLAEGDPLEYSEESLSKYLKNRSFELKKLKIQELYPDDKEDLIEVYKNEIIPLQVRAVAQYWYNAVVEANNR